MLFEMLFFLVILLVVLFGFFKLSPKAKLYTLLSIIVMSSMLIGAIILCNGEDPITIDTQQASMMGCARDLASIMH